jgi:hypothetical protein
MPGEATVIRPGEHGWGAVQAALRPRKPAAVEPVLELAGGMA